MRYNTALEYTRYNSGKHFLDSGFESGRHWQQPKPPQEDILLGTDPWDASINLTKLLADLFESDIEGARFYKWANNIPAAGWDWFGLTSEYLESRGYVQLARDNTYNGENHLSQNYVYEVWQRPGADVADWIWADNDEVLVVLYVHTGADIRGGYSKPMFGNFDCDYSLPVDNCVEWYLEPLEGEDLTDEAESINDNGYLSSGYSGNPTYEAESRGISWEYDCRHGNGYKVTLDGVEMVMVPSRPYMGE